MAPVSASRTDPLPDTPISSAQPKCFSIRRLTCAADLRLKRPLADFYAAYAAELAVALGCQIVHAIFKMHVARAAGFGCSGSPSFSVTPQRECRERAELLCDQNGFLYSEDSERYGKKSSECASAQNDTEQSQGLGPKVPDQDTGS
jgi:hypothetical protein